MYGLVQAGNIYHKAIYTHLKHYEYDPEIITQGLWTHQHRDIYFILVADKFGIKYRDKKDADHLIAETQDKYEVTKD